MRQRNWITRPRRPQYHAHVMAYWNHIALLKKDKLTLKVLKTIEEREQERIKEEEKVKKAG
jgi:hypothetical protein